MLIKDASDVVRGDVVVYPLQLQARDGCGFYLAFGWLRMPYTSRALVEVRLRWVLTREVYTDRSEKANRIGVDGDPVPLPGPPRQRQRDAGVGVRHALHRQRPADDGHHRAV